MANFKTPYVDINRIIRQHQIRRNNNFKTPYVDINLRMDLLTYNHQLHFKTPYVDINPNKINAFLFTKMKLY